MCSAGLIWYAMQVTSDKCMPDFVTLTDRTTRHSTRLLVCLRCAMHHDLSFMLHNVHGWPVCCSKHSLSAVNPAKIQLRVHDYSNISERWLTCGAGGACDVYGDSAGAVVPLLWMEVLSMSPVHGPSTCEHCMCSEQECKDILCALKWKQADVRAFRLQMH